MRLLDHITVIISISRIILHTHALPPYISSSHLWFPDDVQVSFIDLKHFTAQRGSLSLGARRRGPSKSSSGLFFSGSSSSTSVSKTPDIEALHYFQNEYRTNPVRRTALLKEVFQYLALKDFSSPKHFEEWCRELEAACSPPNNPIQYSGLIIYGLQTLILQNHERGDLTALISPAVSRLTSTLRASQAQTPPDSTQRVWVQEMLDPESGLTSTLGTWNEFNIIIVSEKTLQRLRQAIALNEPIRVRLQLPIIEKIFSNPPPKNLSAHSRIAAIASLFHAMSMSAWQVQRDASSIAEKILAAENFFIFPYERRLLSKLLLDYQQRPLNWNVENPLLTPHQPEDSAEEEAHRGDESPPASIPGLPFDFTVHPR